MPVRLGAQDEEIKAVHVVQERLRMLSKGDGGHPKRNPLMMSQAASE